MSPTASTCPACFRPATPQIAAYLIDPGRSGYEIDDLAEEQGVVPLVQADEDTAALVARGRHAAASTPAWPTASSSG